MTAQADNAHVAPWISGTDLRRLAARAGQTPFFAYGRSAIEARVRLLRDTLPAGTQLHYSVKANPMPAVVQLLAGCVDGFDVASAAEMALALDTGVSPQQVGFAGPGKSLQDLRRAVAAGVPIHVESVTQLRHVAALGWELGVRPGIAIRVNPDFSPGRSGMRMGGSAGPFGVDAAQVPALLDAVVAQDLTLAGFHVFWGSQCLHAPTIIEAQEQSLAMITRLCAGLAGAPGFINFGGGFGIPYFPGERALDLHAVGTAMHAWHARLREQLPGTQAVIELGRYLTGEAGIYVCRVIDRKISGGQTFLVTDGGMHHHLAASGNFGQVLRRNYPVVLAQRTHSHRLERCSVVGCLCTPLDRIAHDVMLPVAEIGDFVVVLQSGAYGRSASPGDFLGHPPPVEMLV
ncbi:pyridoxal-dependent decarboxylase, exosortase A system-associated [Paraburkholderia phosphatilytica]|uniref:pyridoxal-dependent decarboxylase, exosortase A system-associated n=1 Tax=Paraburkholderia phosphatilytica TaxID=2282883 RepID=UPI000E4AE54F|nr:pyridoxal-dependent decarboxylase, exosortase A system-associated [Paraburkholderia phosphatilytica]